MPRKHSLKIQKKKKNCLPEWKYSRKKTHSEYTSVQYHMFASHMLNSFLQNRIKCLNYHRFETEGLFYINTSFNILLHNNNSL